MKIGVIASIAHRVPPRDYGPWEQIASTLTEGFVARGHEVTLFATADSVTSTWLRSTSPTGYEEDLTIDAKVAEGLHNASVFERAGDFDILANHFDFMPLTYSRLVTTPMVTTIHGFSSEKIIPVYKAYDDIGRYVSISDSDRSSELHYDATIYHGIEVEEFTFEPEIGEYLLFLGRIHPDKGTHSAIRVAREAGIPLVIAGIVQDQAYFDSEVKPHVDGSGVSYIGPVGPIERNGLLGGARALLHLINFAEPFGLSVIEALATGTPVIATPLGSMPELIRPGTNGFLVSSVADAVSAVTRLATIERSQCRADAETRFGAARMIDDYLDLFETILTQKSPRHPGSVQEIGSPGLFSHANR
jgi:glycosyltransferase involved in cell wall biosynthesis